MTEDFDQGFEEVGLAAPVLAYEDINEAGTVKFKRKVAQVLVLADEDGFQAHRWPPYCAIMALSIADCVSFAASICCSRVSQRAMS
jgi:hypothetical protein